MSTTVSRSQMFTVTTTVNDQVFDLMKRTPEVAEAAKLASAKYWHNGILPEHFKAGVQSRYGYAPRSHSYQRSQHRGKPLLVLSGSLRNDLTRAAQFKTIGGSATELKMFSRVLNLAPTMPQNSDDLYVKRKGTRGYPNLKREIKVITADENESISEVATDHFVMQYEKAQAGDGNGRFDITSDASKDFYPRKS